MAAISTKPTLFTVRQIIAWGDATGWMRLKKRAFKAFREFAGIDGRSGLFDAQARFRSLYAPLMHASALARANVAAMDNEAAVAWCDEYSAWIESQRGRNNNLLWTIYDHGGDGDARRAAMLADLRQDYWEVCIDSDATPDGIMCWDSSHFTTREAAEAHLAAQRAEFPEVADRLFVN